MSFERSRPKFRAAAAALVLGISCGPAMAQDLRPITFVQPSPSAINSYPIVIAAAEGYFAEEGLEVTVQSINGSGAVLQALSAGQAQFGRPGPTPVIAARARGVDAVFIYNVAARANFGIVVPEDSPIQSLDELRGKTIGTGTADGAEVGFARNVLTGAGLKEGTDYTFLTVGDGGPATAAFARKDMDAYVSATSDAAILHQRGVKIRDITPESYAKFFGNGLVTTGEIIKTDPALVEGFGRAVAKAQKFAEDDANRDKVLAALAEANPQEGEDPAFAAALFDAVRSKYRPIDPTRGYGYNPPEVWDEVQKAMIASGDLAAPLPDLTAAYTNDFVAEWNEGLQ
ncbi:ABC transporter substrate-binding protein [uncultured Paracoccus sp.]|uniref:ABC transporter substrate-binding protein n=1 Tax=uncultured Paracoccus sp. TaxID=189685 RepID=UPI0025DCC85F|nr:ABC transporter substrate-binding protein [uncultured Paracoccus sp.]